MIINTAGEYTLQYTATDACGNSTTVERDLVVLPPPRTVLYTDGTFIINERPQDIEANIQAHGQPTDVYDPLDASHNYVFTSSSSRPWNGVRTSITHVEIGSEIHPTSTQYWFNGFTHCESIDTTNLHTENVTNMASMFSGCNALTSLDVSSFITDNTTSMASMFTSCSLLESIDVSNFNTENVTNMSSMFYNCYALQNIDVTGFVTSRVTSMNGMFFSCKALTSINVLNFVTDLVTDMGNMFLSCENISSLDLSSFKTNRVTKMSSMFQGCKALTTILVSSLFTVANVTSSSDMFNSMSTNLVGGAGTVWASGNPKDKTYAHIDGGTADPGYFTAKS